MLNNLWDSFWGCSPLIAILAIIGLIVVWAAVCIAGMWVWVEAKGKYETLWTVRRMYKETFAMEKYFLDRLEHLKPASEEVKNTYKVWIEDSFHDYRMCEIPD